MPFPENEQTVADLLAGYARILAELRRRGVVRSNNAPAGDYAEWLAARGLGGALADNSSVKSYDITLPSGERVQVKARVVSEPPIAGQLQTSPFRSSFTGEGCLRGEQEQREGRRTYRQGRPSRVLPVG